MHTHANRLGSQHRLRSCRQSATGHTPQVRPHCTPHNVAAAHCTPHNVAAAAATGQQQQQPQCNNPASSQPLRSRRDSLLAGLLSYVAAAAAVAPPPARAATSTAADIEQIEVEAFEAYANREFATVLQKLSQILAADPDNPRWYEMRAQVLVDAKQFNESVADFNKALTLISPTEQPVVAARLTSGRALAWEGLSKWSEALADYEAALELAAAGGESPDAYIINAVGNCYNSLQQWAPARESYLTSSQLFQQAKGFRGRGGTTTQRLDGAIYAASNAALMLAQLGEEEGALKEFEKVSRRAPGSSDTRAALAALYYRAGQLEKAEAAWQFACENITAGCSKYQDTDWLRTVRRWPPVMVGYLQDFLKLQ